MTCERVSLPGGGFAIVCGTRTPRQKCKCGQPATLLCDWKIPDAEDHQWACGSSTCDSPICARGATSPAPGKDLCPKHAVAFEDWKARHRRAEASEATAPLVNQAREEGKTANG